ncbi:hypothetical protein GCM10022399_44240 [Terrabacter ginsenosidimutans]|uniref:Fibronectin type-III domain-containing protein n=1 Tax=Terrabacter ginsenosidimutans TaxID=490575 RepID=A0ABP7ETC0_9MICO
MLAVAALVGALLPLTAVLAGPAAAAGPCGPPAVSVIACENTQTGTPGSDWQVSGAGDSTIQGFATAMSVNVGETVTFKVSTPARAYHLDILRMGYYQGNGARKIAANVLPSATLPQTQPSCLTQANTGLVDCGNWAVSASWTVPSTAVSGVYLAHLVRNDTGGSSLIPFVVRNDASHSDLLVQTSDQTWQAYNTYGGNSLYTCSTSCPPGNPAPYKGASMVSYNRPFHSAADDNGRSWLMYAEYPMIRFLEANGYDVAYTSGVDTGTTAGGALLRNHKTFLSVGHDEYWSGTQRTNVEAARDAGVNLAFFSGNEVFWKTRFQASIDGTSTANRTLVCYKETHYDGPVDPQDPPTWTGTWQDPRFSPPADGGNPQNSLTGQQFIVNSGTTDIKVPAQYAKLRFWRNTAVASLAPGQTRTLAPGVGTLGYEWDMDPDNGFRPAGAFRLSSTTSTTAEIFTDYGGTTQANQSATHNLTLYKAASGALVFGSGTVQWSWGLGDPGSTPDPVMQQATVNLFADMGAQPYALASGLTVATASTDTTAPTSAITTPSSGATLGDGGKLTISGTASDTGGVVAGVEVSTDNGKTWHPATGTTSWNYSWVAHGNPGTTIRSRAVDDSGNLETPSAGVPVTIGCTCSVWGVGASPGVADSGSATAREVGIKFRSEASGYITGIRFYKSTGNTGTHTGSLWSASGSRLATATFTNESASGWQQVSFASPVAINANATYVASYYAPKGHTAADENYLYPPPSPGPYAGGWVDSPPLHALRNINGTTNGMFVDSTTSAFPTSSDSATNYWVDVMFSQGTAAATPPAAPTSVTATAGNASALVSWAMPPDGGSPITGYTVTPYVGATAQTPTTVTGNPPATTVNVSGLTNGTAYTFKVSATNTVGTGPDSAASSAVTPVAVSCTPCTIWTPSTVPSTIDQGDTNSTELGTKFKSDVNGQITGIRFYKGSGNTGTHVGSLWTSTGTKLASATFTNETATGWQQVSFASPVTISAGTVYVASFFAPNGHYAADSFYFSTGVDNPPLHALQDGVSGGNGVYRYTTSSAFPNSTYQAEGYYVDVVFSTVTAAPTAPAAPTSVTATAGDKQATVSWTAPANGGSALTSYTVTPYAGTTAGTPTTVSGSPPATTTTVTGLTNGTAYTFKVSATNAIGTGPDSAASTAVTPTGPTAPAAPTSVTATAGDKQATVSWTAPANGGSAITSYTVTPYAGTTAGTPTTVSGSPPATTTTVTGLTNGTAYTFKVSATNAIGTGPDSAASTAVTPTGPTAPAAPTGVTATAGDKQATVSWTAPSNGGSAITSYTVTPYAGTTAQTPTTVSGSPPATTTTVTGLTNGTAYTFKVSATNAIGTGPDSAASTAVTPTGPTAPAAPTGVTATAGDKQATVSWTAPSNGGSAITSYTVTPYAGTTALTPTTVSGSPPATTTTVTGLTNGTAYTFKVSATNAIGTGPDSAASTAVTPTGPTAPAAPTGVTATAGDKQATVSWTAPSNGGSAITSYTVTPYAGTTALTPTTVSGSPPATTTTVTGLTNGTAYTFKVSATNAIGTGPDSAASTAVTPAASNGCTNCTIWPVTANPANPSIADSSSVELGVKFKSDVNGQVTGIRFYKGTGNTGVHTGTLWSATGTKLASATFTNESATGWQQVDFATPVAITAGTVYVASYFAPLGHYAGDTNAFATAGVDNPPLHALKDGTSGSNGTYTYSGSSTFPSSTYQSTNYWVDVVFSGSTTAPSAPTGVTAKAGDQQATVSWTAPSNGGSAITSYTVTPYVGTTAQTTTTVSGSPPATTATVTGLTNGTAYSFKVSATNAIGTGPDSTFSNTVTPTVVTGCTACTIWATTATPANPSIADGSGVELGVKFKSDVNGQITGIRFYKGTGNTGTHTGTLWTSTGTKLASATFTNETASGWQEVDFATPVAITAGTVYVASYFAPVGHYAGDNSTFATAGVDNPPLHALQDGVSGGNGTYAYGGSSTFPNNTFQASNYWVDVVFAGG